MLTLLTAAPDFCPHFYPLIFGAALVGKTEHEWATGSPLPVLR